MKKIPLKLSHKTILVSENVWHMETIAILVCMSVNVFITVFIIYEGFQSKTSFLGLYSIYGQYSITGSSFLQYMCNRITSDSTISFHDFFLCTQVSLICNFVTFLISQTKKKNTYEITMLCECVLPFTLQNNTLFSQNFVQHSSH